MIQEEQREIEIIKEEIAKINKKSSEIEVRIY
jgi:hypothetical protein